MNSLYYDKSIKSAVTPLVSTPRSVYTSKTQIKYKTGQLTTRRITRTEMVPKTNDYKIHIVKAKEEKRPDIIAYKYYANPILYSFILSYNNLYSPLQVTQGMSLKIPDIFSIYGSEGIMENGGTY